MKHPFSTSRGPRHASSATCFFSSAAIAAFKRRRCFRLAEVRRDPGKLGGKSAEMDGYLSAAPHDDTRSVFSEQSEHQVLQVQFSSWIPWPFLEVLGIGLAERHRETAWKPWSKSTTKFHPIRLAALAPGNDGKPKMLIRKLMFPMF